MLIYFVLGRRLGSGAYVEVVGHVTSSTSSSGLLLMTR